MPTQPEWSLLLRQLSSFSIDQAELNLDEPLAPRTTFGIGGSARVFVRAKRAEAVSTCLQAAEMAHVPWFVLGWGSNILVSDKGLEALVLILEGDLAAKERHAESFIVGGGASFPGICRESISAGLSGLECLTGIPSSVGGALAMNAGAYGQEIFDVLSSVDIVENDGSQRHLLKDEIPHGYRWSVLGKGRVVVRAELHLRDAGGDEVKARAKDVRNRRSGVLPAEPSAGSVFRNPPGDFAGRLLEEAGCKGLRIGGAQVSHQHANVLINTGAATAREVQRLIHEMWSRVERRYDTRLVLELKVLDEVGRAIDDPASLA